MYIHRNPHYWLDPDNGRRVAKGIATKLERPTGRCGVTFSSVFRTSTTA